MVNLKLPKRLSAHGAGPALKNPQEVTLSLAGDSLHVVRQMDKRSARVAKSSPGQWLPGDSCVTRIERRTKKPDVS